MPTGACGINCDVCKLKLMGICSTCGPGKSLEAANKLEAQERILGNNCAILACARLNRIEYCLRDCNAFPCDNFHSGPYPFARGFLTMQERRRKERPPALTHNRTPVEVPPEYWEKLQQREITELCNLTLASPHSSAGFTYRFLQEYILVDSKDRCLKRSRNDRWEMADDPLLELVTLLYFINVRSFHALGKDIVAPHDLKEAHYFKGRHALDLGPLLERYGNDLEGFQKAAEGLHGKAMEMADAAYMLLPFPRVPLYYLLWEGDEEFGPKLSVLFDRSIEEHLSASGIWALASVVSSALLRGPYDTAP